MKLEKVIEIINRQGIMKTNPKTKSQAEIREALRCLVEAGGKKIPKEPFFEGDGSYNTELVYDTWICPNCNSRYEIDIDEYDYCPNCGQRIAWE